jgi:hypothetical protein
MTRRSLESGNALVAELVTVVCNATGKPIDVVAPFIRPAAQYLDAEYGGQNLYKKAARSTVDVAAIERDYVDVGIAARVVCALHGISVTKFYLLKYAHGWTKGPARKRTPRPETGYQPISINRPVESPPKKP